MASDEWQWIDSGPKVRMLCGEVARDCWLTQEAADRLNGLGSTYRVRLGHQTKNGTPRGVPLNRDAVTVLREQIGKHAPFCFTYRGEPIKRNLSNHAWFTVLGKAGLEDFRFYDLRHTRPSWRRQSGTNCDELEDFGGWKTRSRVDRYAKFATEHPAAAASRIEATNESVIELAHFRHSATK